MNAQIITTLAALTILLDVLIAAFLPALFSQPMRSRIVSVIRTHARLGIFVLSFGALLLTLFIQYGIGFSPCVLCWWQRVMMVPIVIISFVSIIRNDTFSTIAAYIATLASIGAAIALYQHLLQILPSGTLIPCDPTNDCATRVIFEFHFVTLPWMALTLFATLLIIALVARKAD